MKSLFTWFAALVCATTFTVVGAASENGVTAHRGNSSEFPENSISAMRSAIELGADWIEIDIFKTLDGKIVICHDAQTKNVAGVDLNIPASTFEQLQKLDMAAGFRRSKGLTETECPPLPVLQFEDAVRLILEHKKARLSIQPKNDCVDQAIEIVRKMNATAWVGFNDGNLKLMARVKELEPSIPVFWDRFDWNPEADIATAKKHGFESLVVHFSKISPQQIEQVKNAGLRIGVWTVNDPAVMKKFLLWNIDRIYTDHPRTLLALLREQSISFR